MSDQILLIDKEVGWTSNDVVRKLKGILFAKTGEKVKIGHAGTLDPFATGLLLIMLGRSATKKFDQLQTLKKEYIAEIEFGKKTDTYDVTGETVFNYEGEIILDKNKIQKYLEENLGKIKQTPPIFSAVKINGKRAYDLARAGKEVKTKERIIEIYETEVLDLQKDVLTVRYVVSSGTYIRSLAYELGEFFGYGAFLKSLRRTKIGDYKVEDAKKLSVV